ncbi:MAG: dihydrofolate reductase family protein [Anaerolineae bacterium]
MRKMRLHMHVSADDYAAGPNGEMEELMRHMDSDTYRYDAALYEHSDLVIAGRVLYEGLKEYWPKLETDEKASRQERAFAHLFNSMPKLILSTTLDSVGWQNCRLLKENVFEELRKLKEQPGRDIVVTGGIGTARGLIQHGLIDEFNLLVHPVMLGTGKSLFAGLEGTRELQLIRTKRFRTGVVAVEYRLAPAQDMQKAA